MDAVEELGQEIASLSARLDAATHRLLECIRRFDEACGWHEQGAVSCAHWLAWRLGWDPATAREKVRVARALGKLPAIDDALRAARLSYAKARALTRVATPDNEAKLLEMALIATGAQLERLCRGYRGALGGERTPAPEERSVRLRLLPGGMVKLELVLEPDEADLILRAIERAREVHAQQAEPLEPEAPAAPDAPGCAMIDRCATDAPGEAEAAEAAGVSAETSWPSRADGVVKLAESFLAGNPVTGTGGERFQVMVHLDQEVLGPGGVLAERVLPYGIWAATLEDGTRVSAETLRRVACDCGLVAIGRDAEALNIGRRARTIPPAIRRALMLRDRGCAFPGCIHTAFLHGHHIEHWLHGGETSLNNLVMLCTFHHHLVHEGGWTVTAGADSVFAFHSPAGTLLAPQPPHELVNDTLDWLRRWADERNLDLGHDVNMPQWDGKTPDYDCAAEWLLAAGQ
ncbi:MAG: DUF222 domain-containing protein [Spirochaetia bacterium]